MAPGDINDMGTSPIPPVLDHPLHPTFPQPGPLGLVVAEATVTEVQSRGNTHCHSLILRPPSHLAPSSSTGEADGPEGTLMSVAESLTRAGYDSAEERLAELD